MTGTGLRRTAAEAAWREPKAPPTDRAADAEASSGGPVAVLLLVELAPGALLWGWSRVALGALPLRQVPGLRFAKALGSGQRGGFGLRPSLRRQGLFVLFDRERDADAFIAASPVMQAYRNHAGELCIAKLRATASRGSWSGQGIAVTAKRTYRIVTAGRCVLADEQVPIEPELVVDDGLLVADTDLLSFKPGTDVVVTAEAHAKGGRAVTETTAGVRVENRTVTVRVVGKRRVVRRNGSWAFSDPEPFAKAPLGWREAYGGIDAAARERLDAPLLAPLQKYSQYDLKFATAAAYPRNPVGKGYLLEDGPRVEGLELPTVEDPDDPITYDVTTRLQIATALAFGYVYIKRTHLGCGPKIKGE